MTSHDVLTGASDLRASEELNRRIIEATPGGIVHVGTDGRIVSANAEAQRILGLSFDQLTLRYTSDFTPDTVWEDGSPCAAEDYPVSRALLTGKAQPSATIGVRRPDGEISWAVFTAVPLLAPEGSVCGAVVTFLDITGRRQVENKLRQSEARLRALVESIPAIILTINRAGVIGFLSRTIAGMTVEQSIGLSMYEYVPESERSRVRANIARVLATGNPTTFEVTVDPWLGGTHYQVVVGAIRVGDEIQGATIMATDISEQKELEARLLLSDRMSSIGTLAAGVAHEINNPLTYVLANLDLLLIRLGTLDPSLAPRVQEAVEGAERIREVVRDLTAFSARDDSMPRAVRLSDTIERAARMATQEIRRRARLVCEFADVPDVLGHGSRVGQVFLNLLINAAHAIPEGNPDTHEIRVRTQLGPKGFVRTSISDSGVGIERALLGRIFDPFVTTKGVGQGTGLGLYISHGIVKALGGAIWVESEVGRGTRFHVDLPAYGTHAQVSEVARDPELCELTGLHILIVEDEPSIAAFLKRGLPHNEVAIANSGSVAIAALDARNFDVVLCDLIMPDRAGMDVYAHVAARASEQAPRFVFVTGAALTESAQELLRTTGSPVVKKPFTISDIKRALLRVLPPRGV